MSIFKAFNTFFTKRAQLAGLFALLIAVQTLSAQSSFQLRAPELFIQLDSTCRTPDAMALDPSGNIYLSITNATTFDQFGAKILKLSPTGKLLQTWTALPKHPESGKIHPMGMAFGTDGFLYLVDNQSFAGLKNSSRVLRAKLQNGEIQNIETVVSGLNVANGLRFNNGYIYVTDTWTDNKRKSGLFRFNIQALSKPISVHAKNRANYLVHEMELDSDVDDGVGMDGLDFDADGNLYVGNFSNGTISSIKLNQKSAKSVVTRLIKDEHLVGCDGIFFDKASNALLIANFLNNSILHYTLADKKLTTLWQNDDAECNAALDCPCDLAIINDKLVVVNFDTYTTNANKTIDNCNTVSVFDIRRNP